MQSGENRVEGVIAQRWCSMKLPVSVLQSANGYYLGTSFNGMPVSRESLEFYDSVNEAMKALDSGIWTQREHP